MTPLASAVSHAKSRVVCVTGMHRGGTSVMARAVNLLGISFGASEGLMFAGSDNPAGYWENRAIKELDDELLAHLGGAWDQPPVLEPGWEDRADLDAFRERATAILDRDFAEARQEGAPIGWKEPRLCLLLPFWRTVVAIAATIVVVRDPREVSASLRTRNGMETPQAALLWLRYLLAATADCGHHLVVPNQALSEDIEATLVRIARHLELPAPGPQVVRAVRDHIDPSLVHQVASPVEPAEVHPLMRLALDVWNGGDVNPERIPESVATSIARGWLGAPESRAKLTEARARVVELQEQVRKYSREARLRRGESPFVRSTATAAPPAGGDDVPSATAAPPADQTGDEPTPAHDQPDDAS